MSSEDRERLEPATPPQKEPGKSPADTRIRRVALPDTVAEALRSAILTGELAPSTFLREGELAARYGVSRQSLRAAMIELLHTGLLRREMNRGFWVPQPTAADVDDVFDMRELIDSEAARRLSGRHETATDAEAILNRLERHRPDATGQEVVATHFDFHRAVIAAAGSPRLLKFYDLLFADTWLSLGRATWNSPYVALDVFLRHHRVLIEAVRSGDPERAASVAREHVITARPTAVGVVADKGDEPQAAPRRPRRRPESA